MIRHEKRTEAHPRKTGFEGADGTAMSRPPRPGSKADAFVLDHLYELHDQNHAAIASRALFSVFKRRYARVHRQASTPE